MATQQAFGDTILPIVLKLGMVLIGLLIVIIIFGLFIGVILYIRRKKKFNRDIIILRRKHSGGVTIEFDKGGYMKNKSGDYKFRLLKNKSYVEGNYKYDITKESGGNVVFLFRDTADTFHHIEPKLNLPLEKVLDNEGKPIPILDKKGELVYDENGKPKYLNTTKLDITVTSEDVEWAKGSFIDYVITYSKKSTLSEYIPIIGMSIFVVLVLVLIYLLLQKFEVLGAVADALKTASENVLSMKQSGIITNAPA